MSPISQGKDATSGSLPVSFFTGTAPRPVSGRSAVGAGMEGVEEAVKFV